MLKVLGSMMLLCGCIGIGLQPVNQMDKRIKTLQTLICGLEVMDRELSFRMPLLEEILSVAAWSIEDPARSFFSACRDELSKSFDNPFHEIWNRAAHEYLTALKRSDLNSVFTLGSVLGKYDGEGQRQAIDRAHGALTQALSDAVVDRCSQGKVYKVLGTTAGVFLLILLL